MKNIFISLLILMPLFLLAQEMDQAYLDSLPEEIRKDVLSKIEAKKNIEMPVYRRASSALDKKNSSDSDSEIQLFGSNFFDTMQTSFMPINEPNLDGNYILDFGDTLDIQLIGQKDSINSYSIKRDGTINLSDIGKISIAGLSLDDASSLIKANVSNTYIGTDAYISLTNIRDISILIAGNAYNPGIYTLNGNSNILHALSIAGGIGEFGSYREINLVRDGQILDTLDIYDVLIFGKTNSARSLRSGDSIVVQPVKKVVSVESGVLRTGKYELKEDETFKDLLKFTSGINKNADLNSININRTSQGANINIDVDFKKLSEYKVQRGDSLFISEYKINTITLNGSIKNPGTYQLPNGTTLSEAIKYSGGYDSDAYVFAGYLENDDAFEINRIAKEKLYDAFLNNLINTSNTSSASPDAGLGIVIEQLRDAPVSGRVIAEFDLDMIKANPDLDTILQDGDTLTVPSITQQVFIQGEISNPGAIRYVAGKDIKYYIQNSGGVLQSGDVNNIFIVHPNGETKILDDRSRLSFLAAEDETALIFPGSIIYIPRNADFGSSTHIT